MKGSPSTINYLAVTGLLLLAAVLVYREHPLVQLSSDPPDVTTALFPVGELQPGQSTSAVVGLSNRGLIPFAYSLATTGGAGQPVVADFHLTVRRAGQVGPVYDGRLPADSGSIGTLDPGETARLELTLVMPSAGQGRRSLDFLLHWRAQGSFLTTWWLPIYQLGLALLDLAILGVWLHDALRRQRRPRLAAAARA